MSNTNIRFGVYSGTPIKAQGVWNHKHSMNQSCWIFLCYIKKKKKIQMLLYFPFMHTGHWKTEICSLSSSTFALTALCGFQTSWALLFANICGTPFGPLAEYITRTGLNDLNLGSSFGTYTLSLVLQILALFLWEKKSQRNGERKAYSFMFSVRPSKH